MDFERYIEKVSSDAFIEQAAKRLQQPESRIRSLVRTYANEARVGYALIKPYLSHEISILEVGAGIGILSAYLHLGGWRITALEPSESGFELNNAIGHEVIRWLALRDFGFLDLGVESLDSQVNGKFDLIYSINVVEHLPDLDTAFERMQSVLAPNGTMVHTCPNYHVPYEPHFGILLVPLFPAITRHLLPKNIVESGLWRSLNFVSVSRLRRTARKLSLQIEFEQGVMYHSLKRIENDPLFAERHKGAIGSLYRFLNTTGTLRLIRYWPLLLSTPVNFTCQHKA